MDNIFWDIKKMDGPRKGDGENTKVGIAVKL